MSETSIAVPDPLRIWARLSRTDPKHTKRFQRSGGFSGTAIKPIWTILRMTEVFGPCGTGWGMEKPEFEIQQAVDEWLVFCTVGIWYVEDGHRAIVYGVGGDKFVVSQKSGIRASDEAYKMAYTDAIGNAIKFIGVAADVHMGLFDDNKYVKEMEAEFAGVSDAPALTEERRQELEKSITGAKTVDELLSFFNTALKVAVEDEDAIRYLEVKMTDKMIDLVGTSETMVSLVEDYTAAYKAAKGAGDDATVELLKKAKDRRKAELAKTELTDQLKKSVEGA